MGASSIFKSERGVAAIVLLTALPLLIAILFVSVSLYFVMRSHGRGLHECRVALLEAEEARLESMEKLMQMNTQAKALRFSRELVEEEVRIARGSGIPYLKVAAEIHRQVVIAEQKTFAGVQKAVIFAANRSNEIRIYQLKQKIQSVYRQDAQIYDGTPNIQIDVQSQEKNLGVEPKQKNTPTPDYGPVSNFERHQYMQVRWKLKPAHLLPRWFDPKLVSNETLSLEAQCSTSAERKGEKRWRATLAADKQLLRWF